ncbi:hypothetical protein FBZ83_11959 [Azospirillum brasilense]|uniref:Sce7726 family protein n=1 Tax=Azospirillum brasilense TaxID=192 RepID=A0A560BUX7_AZOBR|nr:sce7726 family protein [Azospirillum brasilense]TWA76408.1 hypothetical protein FBZ83_11959 [Azospirillum brasilense]
MVQGPRPIERLLEPHIKCAIIERLRDRGELQDAVIVSEFAVAGGARRADLAVAGRRLEAFEIKSAADNLDRLLGQVQTYLRYFDKVTIVADEVHKENVLSAAPDGVEVWCFRELPGKIEFRVPKRGRVSTKFEKGDLLKMLKAIELRAILKKKKMINGDERRVQLESAAYSLNSAELREEVLSAVKARYQRFSNAFMSVVQGSSIKSESLQLLSPYKLSSVSRKGQESEEDWGELLRQLRPSVAQAGASADVLLTLAEQSGEERLFGPVPEEIRGLFGVSES